MIPSIDAEIYLFEKKSALKQLSQCILKYSLFKAMIRNAFTFVIYNGIKNDTSTLLCEKEKRIDNSNWMNSGRKKYLSLHVISKYIKRRTPFVRER